MSSKHRHCLFVIACLSTLVVAGCAAVVGPKGPKLISFADRQRATIEPAMTTNNIYGSIADRLQALPQDVYQGTDLSLNEAILNDGAPSKGVRFTVKGSAVSSGMLGLPKTAEIKGVMAKDKETSPVPIEFKADTTGGWQACVPDIEYGTQMQVNMIMPAVHGGTGDLQLFVYPLDKNGSSAAVITHIYRILDERDVPSNEVQVPID
jgi:hypothetical protein